MHNSSVKWMPSFFFDRKNKDSEAKRGSAPPSFKVPQHGYDRVKDMALGFSVSLPKRGVNCVIPCPRNEDIP